MQTVAVANTAAAVKMAKLTREASREKLREALLASARERLRAMDEKMPVVTNAAGNVVEIPMTPQGQQQLSQAAKCRQPDCDVAAAHVVLCAQQRGWLVVTNDPGPLLALGSSLEIESLS